MVDERTDAIVEIHKLIARTIGISWKNFARELDVINESQIDEYDRMYRKDSNKATLQLLDTFRSKRFHNPDEWLMDLRKALHYAKRNDIIERLDEHVVRLGGSARLNLR